AEQPSFCIIAVPLARSSGAPAAGVVAAVAFAVGAAAAGEAEGCAAVGPDAADTAGAAGSLKVAPDWLAMKTTARCTSTSAKAEFPPFGGIAFLPLSALA